MAMVPLADEAWTGWSCQLADLAPVVALDRPGTEASPCDGAPLTPDRMVHIDDPQLSLEAVRSVVRASREENRH